MKVRYSYIVLSVFWSTWLWHMGSGNLAPAILPVIQQSLSLSTSASTLIVSSTFLGQSVSAFLAGFLCQHLGRRKTIILGLVVASLSLLLASLSSYYLTILFLFFLVGIGFGTYLPAAISIISDLTNPKNRGKYIGFHETAAPIGIALGPVFAGLVLLSGLGWNQCLQLWLIPVILILICQIMLVKEPAREMGQQHSHDSDRVNDSGSWSFSQFITLQLAIMFRYVAISVIALFPLYWTRALGVEVSTAAFTLGAVNFMAIFGQVAAGYLSDVFGRLRILILLTLSMSVTLAISVYLPFSPLLIICLVIFSLSNNAFMPVIWTFVSEMTIPEKRSRIIGVTLAIMGISGSLHSGVLGLLADRFGFEAAWFYSIALSFISCAFLAALRASEARAYMPKNERSH